MPNELCCSISTLKCYLNQVEFCVQQLEDVADVVHRGTTLKVTLKNGVTITMKEDPKQRNGHTMLDLDNTFKTAKYQNSECRLSLFESYC